MAATVRGACKVKSRGDDNYNSEQCSAWWRPELQSNNDCSIGEEMKPATGWSDLWNLFLMRMMMWLHCNAVSLILLPTSITIIAPGSSFINLFIGIFLLRHRSNHVISCSIRTDLRVQLMHRCYQLTYLLRLSSSTVISLILFLFCWSGVEQVLLLSSLCRRVLYIPGHNDHCCSLNWAALELMVTLASSACVFFVILFSAISYSLSCRCRLRCRGLNRIECQTIAKSSRYAAATTASRTSTTRAPTFDNLLHIIFPFYS